MYTNIHVVLWLTWHQMQRSNSVDIKNGVESHPVVIKEKFRDFSRKVLVAFTQNFVRCFSTGNAAKTSSREMHEIFAHDPMLLATNIQTHLKKAFWVNNIQSRGRNWPANRLWWVGTWSWQIEKYVGWAGLRLLAPNFINRFYVQFVDFLTEIICFSSQCTKRMHVHFNKDPRLGKWIR